jgi:hypothetical protein
MNTKIQNETMSSSSSQRSEDKYRIAKEYNEKTETGSTSSVEQARFILSDSSKRERMKQLNRKTSRIFG